MRVDIACSFGGRNQSMQHWLGVYSPFVERSPKSIASTLKPKESAANGGPVRSFGDCSRSLTANIHRMSQDCLLNDFRDAT
jgi:hypothetical protein